MSRQSGTRGAVEDVNGIVYFATPLGIQISMQNGRVMQISICPGRAAAPSLFPVLATSRLYVAQESKLYRRGEGDRRERVDSSEAAEAAKQAARRPGNSIGSCRRCHNAVMAALPPSIFPNHSMTRFAAGRKIRAPPSDA